MAKCSKIRNIVWLRQTLRRWRSRAAERVALAAGVPAGHVAVCVGGVSQRFVVRAAHLNHPVFRELLRQAEEEYGFPSGATCGPIVLPCDEEHFQDVLRLVSSSKERPRSRSLRCCGPAKRGVAARHGDSQPLLQGMAAGKLVW